MRQPPPQKPIPRSAGKKKLVRTEMRTVLARCSNRRVRCWERIVGVTCWRGLIGRISIDRNWAIVSSQPTALGPICTSRASLLEEMASADPLLHKCV